MTEAELPLVHFKQWTCKIRVKYYGNGRTALQLNDHEKREVIAIATVNIPNEPQEEDEIFIKDWAENEGMVDALVNAGVIYPPSRRIPTGHVSAAVAKLKIKIDDNSQSN